MQGQPLLLTVGLPQTPSFDGVPPLRSQKTTGWKLKKPLPDLNASRLSRNVSQDGYQFVRSQRAREARGILFRILSVNLNCDEEVCTVVESPAEGYCRAGSEWLKGAETESRRVGG